MTENDSERMLTNLIAIMYLFSKLMDDKSFTEYYRVLKCIRSGMQSLSKALQM